MAIETGEPDFHKHRYFDLMLPSNDMLMKFVGASVEQRVVRHEWPLSCVERVVFEGGIEKYCKTIRVPSMEIEAYTTLNSPLLVPHIVIARSDSSSSLLLDSFDGERLSRTAVEAGGFTEYLDGLRRTLSSISGVGPVFIDLSRRESVRAHMKTMIERLSRLFGPDSVPQIDLDLLRLAVICATSKEVEDAFVEGAVYSNGDLSADNILVRGEAIRIIDWQFPRITSLRVEAVNLLTSLQIDPRTLLPIPVIIAGLLCKIRWLVECADVWLPDGGYHNDIGRLLQRIAELNSYH